MAGLKLNFLNNSDTTVKTNEKEESNDSQIIDTKLIEYIIKEFPDTSKEISKSLINLQVTLEKSIDFIENKSSDVIRNNRDFELSSKYRETCIRLYKISTSLKDYVKWMDVTNEKSTTKLSTPTQKEPLCTSDENFKSYIPIYNDFTSLTQLKFLIDSKSYEVDNWDDLIMKTSSILNTNYKNNKNS
ncbi:MAG: hypothetical protein ACRC68_07790, partial [Clostridium sp.]